MEDAAEIFESTPVEMPSRRRIDWRTGKETVWQPRSFWEECVFRPIVTARFGIVTAHSGRL